MPRINVNPSMFVTTLASFRPIGSMLFVGDERRLHAGQNPVGQRARARPLAFRVFVGFNEGDHQRWKMQDLIDVVSPVRAHHTGDPEATYIVQASDYRHLEDGRAVVEPGAQIMVVDMDATPRKLFEAQLIEVAEVVAARLQRESVLTELQKSGQTVISYVVTPPPQNVSTLPGRPGKP